MDNLTPAHVNIKMNEWHIITDAAAQSLVTKNYDALKKWLSVSGDESLDNNINQSHIDEINSLFISLDSHRECGDSVMVNERARSLIGYLYGNDLMPHWVEAAIYKDFDFKPPEIIGRFNSMSINMIDDTGLARFAITFDFDDRQKTINIDVDPQDTTVFVDGDTVHIS
jgi:hypothetical protein